MSEINKLFIGSKFNQLASTTYEIKITIANSVKRIIVELHEVSKDKECNRTKGKERDQPCILLLQ
jgi:hypothetical protein